MTNKNATASQNDLQHTSWVSSGYRTLELESAGLQALIAALKSDLSSHFNRAVEIIRQAEGRVIVTGMGKVAMWAENRRDICLHGYTFIFCSPFRSQSWRPGYDHG